RRRASRNSCWRTSREPRAGRTSGRQSCRRGQRRSKYSNYGCIAGFAAAREKRQREKTQAAEKEKEPSGSCAKAMSRILLVDDSPHAQRMGERILAEEGYEVVTVSNADSALIRLDDVDPDVVLADTVMPGRTGFEICQFLKLSPRHRHVRV